MIRLLLFALLALTAVETSPFFPGEADLVHSLPGLTFPLSYKHYSGYLESLNSTFLHYWFFESATTGHPEKDPVVLWLNGGPGCSSMLGALTELGPIRLNSVNDSLSPNPFAWNQRANILFLESPGGVGFSFKADGKYNVTDSSVAELNHEALRSFFRKFPHLVENEFYIAGESYAGIYIPTLAVRALESHFPKHFKGVAIGNGYLDVTLLGNSLFHFYYTHGMLGMADYLHLIAECCPHTTDYTHCDIRNSKAPACNAARAHALLKAETPGINPYNIYDICASMPHKGNETSDFNSISYDAVSRQMIAQSLNLQEEEQFYDSESDGTPICADHDYLIKYLNSPEVKKALHIDSRAMRWSSCRSKIGYHAQFRTMRSQVQQMVNGGLKVLIFNGDIDTVCNYLGDQWFTDSLGFRLLSDLRPWTTPSGQTAGFVKFYEKKLTFATVLGAGHMVPTDKPEAALKLFSAFLSPFQEFN